jgi:hypothetical protein
VLTERVDRLAALAEPPAQANDTVFLVLLEREQVGSCALHRSALHVTKACQPGRSTHGTHEN